MQPDMVPLKGNTFPIRSQLRDLGGTFDPALKVWLVPATRIEEARRLLTPESKKPTPRKDQGGGSPELDPQTLSELLGAQFVFLRNAVFFTKKWDFEAEAKIHDFSQRLSAQGKDTGWVERTLTEFKRKLSERKASRELTN
jgi:hypothetical protein